MIIRENNPNNRWYLEVNGRSISFVKLEITRDSPVSVYTRFTGEKIYMREQQSYAIDAHINVDDYFEDESMIDSDLFIVDQFLNSRLKARARSVTVDQQFARITMLSDGDFVSNDPAEQVKPIPKSSPRIPRSSPKMGLRAKVLPKKKVEKPRTRAIDL